MASEEDASSKQSLLSSDSPSSTSYERNGAALQRRRSRLLPSNAAASAGPTPHHHPDNNINNNNGFRWLEPLLEKQTFSFGQVFLVLGTYLGLGSLCFFLTMDQIDGKKTNRVLDAVYFCVVTMTTVGYGDLVPRSILSKLLACVYVFTGMALVGIILSKAADYILEKQEVVLVRAIHLNDTTDVLKEVEAHKMRYKFLAAATVLLLLISLGTLFLWEVEGLEFVDAFYCVCSTVTTLGYGDESFSTGGGRAFAIFWILSSTICLAQFFLYLAELYTENRQRLLVKWVLTRKLTSSDLEAADLDRDRVVSTAEFIVYTLKEMGKIDEGDISMAMERFRSLDVDQSGTLTESDLVGSNDQSFLPQKGPMQQL